MACLLIVPRVQPGSQGIEINRIGNNIMDKYVVLAKNIKKTYQMGLVSVHALRGVSIAIKKGELVAIMGPSGSGKSTLMNIIGCLDRPSEGEYFLNNKDVSRLGRDELAMIRNHEVGFVFQNYNLLPRATALSNVMLPLRYRRGINDDHAEQRARQLLIQVGLKDRISHKPFELSGGEQQRVAIARALVNNPSIILADEPTGNLDSKSGQEILSLLMQMNRDGGVTTILVTHALDIANKTQRIINLEDGMVKA